MTLPSFEIAPGAEWDLKEIVAFTETRWGAEQASVYYSALFDQIDVIAQFPEIGSVFGSNLAGFRRFKFESHFIYYRRLDRTRMRVLRVFHVRRLVTAHMLDDGV